ncbi:hypothetical protein ABVT39_022375 [Epinephelus coioides]
MARLERLALQNREPAVRKRVLRDRIHPLDVYDDFDIYCQYRFRRNQIMRITDMLASAIEHGSESNGPLPPSLQAICDHRGRFIDVCSGFPGSVHDARVLKNSPVYVEQLYPPEGRCILGDGGYPCLAAPIRLMTPYRGPHLNPVQARFNRMLSRARNIIKRTFGMMKARWRSIFFKSLEVSPTFAPVVITCCTVLHNLCVDNGDMMEPDEDEAGDDGPEPGHRDLEPVSGNTISLLEPPTVASPIPEDDDPGEGTSGAAGAADEVDEETVSLDSRRFEVSCQMKVLIQSTMNSQAIRQLYVTHLKRQIQLADLDIEYKRRQMADLSVESEIKRRKLRKLNLEIKKLEREGGRVNAIVFEERGTVPEKIKIVGEVEASSVAGRPEPGIQQEQPGEASVPATKCGNGTGDKNGLSTSA